MRGGTWNRRLRGLKARALRGLKARSEEKALASLAPAACDPSPLRPLTAEELREVFRSPPIDREWAKTAGSIGEACAIEDGCTEGVNPGDRRAVYYLVAAFGPRSVLEVGTHVGASTLHIAVALRRAAPGFADGPRLTTVDIRDVNDPVSGYWRKAGLAMSPREMAAALQCSEGVRFVVADSVDYLDRCRERHDFIFLDGDHSAPTVYREVPRALRLLRPGGVILLHDYFPENRALWSDGSVVPGPFLAMERLCAEQPELSVLPVGELPWGTKLGSRRTTFAVLTRRLRSGRSQRGPDGP